MDSFNLSVGERSGFREKGGDRDHLLARILVTSTEWMNLTKIGLGWEEEELNFPKRKESLID